MKIIVNKWAEEIQKVIYFLKFVFMFNPIVFLLALSKQADMWSLFFEKLFINDTFVNSHRKTVVSSEVLTLIE